MRVALLVDCFQQLPILPGKNAPSKGKAILRAATDAFKKQVAERYTEGTLMRLLSSPEALTRRAALFALGLLGTMEANEAVVARLRDDERDVHSLAVETLWSLWFRADAANSEELYRSARQRDASKAREGLDRLIDKAPEFAEAYNQRAILAFRRKQYEQSMADCEKVLELNPYHFAAQAGLGQCFMRLRKHRAALRAFRSALRINPRMDDIAQTVRDLEKALGEEELH